MATITTGVIHNNTATWLIEEIHEAINLDYNAHCAECKKEYHDDCWEDSSADTLLIGFIHCAYDDPDAWYRFLPSTAYKPDPAADFTAICGEINTQVIASKWAARCALCSPCYPGQGDLETPGPQLAYCLPPTLFDSPTDFDTSRILSIAKEVA